MSSRIRNFDLVDDWAYRLGNHVATLCTASCDPPAEVDCPQCHNRFVPPPYVDSKASDARWYTGIAMGMMFAIKLLFGVKAERVLREAFTQGGKDAAMPDLQPYAFAKQGSKFGCTATSPILDKPDCPPSRRRRKKKKPAGNGQIPGMIVDKGTNGSNGKNGHVGNGTSYGPEPSGEVIVDRTNGFDTAIGDMANWLDPMQALELSEDQPVLIKE